MCACHHLFIPVTSVSLYHDYKELASTYMELLGQWQDHQLCHSVPSLNCSTRPLLVFTSLPDSHLYTNFGCQHEVYSWSPLENSFCVGLSMLFMMISNSGNEDFLLSQVPRSFSWIQLPYLAGECHINNRSISKKLQKQHGYFCGYWEICLMELFKTE